MLASLHIENYALIDTLDIELSPGLTIITGETGAGKSIILGALGLLMGARADVKQLRDAGRRIVVEAAFKNIGSGFMRDILLSEGVEEDEAQEIISAVESDGMLVLRREVSPTGRSKALVNEVSVPMRRIGSVARRLVDIHSQRSTSLLDRPEFRLSILDAIAGNSGLVADYRHNFGHYAGLRRQRQAKMKEYETALQQRELNSMKLERLRELKPRAGEQKELEKRVEILSAAEEIRESVSGVMRLLDGSDGGVLSSLHGAVSELSRVNPAALEQDGEGSAVSLLDRLRSAEIEIRDIADTLGASLEGMESDPVLLQKSEQRLEAIYAEEKRFGVEGDADLVRIKDELEASFAAVAEGDEAIRELEIKVKTAAKQLRESSSFLTASRRKAAEQFSEGLLRLARPLGLPNLNFAAALEPAPRMTADGADNLQFFCAFNKNQSLRPLSEIASGGEMSRVMLCVKAVMAGRMQMPTVIFDEIDTGVSGDIADRMGRMMRRMGEGMQVIAITHLPQVAVMGRSHFKVYKEDSSDATLTHVRSLDGKEREREIARMLAGSVVDEAAVLNARSLLSRDSD